MYYLRKKKPKKKEPDALPLFDQAGVKVSRKTDYVKKLDKIFSLYIRLRDTLPGGLTPCISCGQYKRFDKMDCGHYYSRRHMATRFDEDNCHAECSQCNRFRADHLIGYRENLLRKIGQQRFDKLAWKASQTRHWTDFELKELIKYYQEKIKEIKKQRP